jgi:hypothetical protein
VTASDGHGERLAPERNEGPCIRGHSLPRQRVAKAQLANGIGTPAFECSVVEARAEHGVVAAYKGYRAGACPELNLRKTRAHLPGRNTSVNRVANAKLTKRVVAPTLDSTRVEQRTRGVLGRRNLSRGVVRSQVYGIARSEKCVRCAEAVLASVALAPTLDLAARKHDAGVAMPRAHIDGWFAQRYRKGRRARGNVAQAQLPGMIATPTEDPAGVCQRAGVRVARGHGLGWLSAQVEEGARSGGTKLPIAVLAPALDLALSGSGAGELHTGGNLDGPRAGIRKAEIRSHFARAVAAGVEITDPKRAAEPVAPAFDAAADDHAGHLLPSGNDQAILRANSNHWAAGIGGRVRRRLGAGI